MRKPAGQFACRRECASSFRLELALVLVLVVLLVLAVEEEIQDEQRSAS
jgi:hypothetical protein